MNINQGFIRIKAVLLVWGTKAAVVQFEFTYIGEIERGLLRLQRLQKDTAAGRLGQRDAPLSLSLARSLLCL